MKDTRGEPSVKGEGFLHKCVNGVSICTGGRFSWSLVRQSVRRRPLLPAQKPWLAKTPSQVRIGRLTLLVECIISGPLCFHDVCVLFFPSLPGESYSGGAATDEQSGMSISQEVQVRAEVVL